MKIYTKQGDTGQTGLLGAQRVSKANLQVSAYGDVDELNSVIGMARAEGLDPQSDQVLQVVQQVLFNVGSELASDPQSLTKLKIALVADSEVALLEQAIDNAELKLQPLQAFILPGGSKPAAILHLARTVCRRAERTVVALHETQTLRAELLRYINRLSDLLFVFARLENARTGYPDVIWQT